ncbi:DJ-1/PfpI family protein [Rhodococcus sp. OK302]|uniref:DJ-1/PfpI family protein n=1 Tax=Rhodococcus sp. OK302 TaxID=1882769 RepID=UPI000B942D26|nr:DJ-1/PfpI family protein [Rhodococcus sp. OK302]OYD71705.1 DJ-1/PfpI family protein [Rhodococcus sp. OK302]
MNESRRRLSIVLFEGFELLDVFGPLGLFGMVPETISVELVGPTAGPVRSSQGTEVLATVGYEDAHLPDIVLVPGGQGTRRAVADRAFLDWLNVWATDAQLVTSVCTGSAVLAAAGLLDGYRATANKRAYEWATSHGSSVTWVARARWVEDQNRWTSSGVAAGMDMAAALIARLCGSAMADAITKAAELEVQTDPDWDPFAAVHSPE